MNKQTWKNRALSVLLTVIMVFSMLPLSVFAAGGAVAEVDGTAYTNLIKAFDAAQGKESATVKLLADVSASGYDGDSEYCVSYGGYNFESGKVTLDLNGKTLTWTASSGRAPCVYGATLTVQDNQGGGTLYSEKGEALQITSGTLNIQSGTIESDGSNALKIQGGNVYITGGTIKSNQYFGNGVNVSPDTVNNRTATLTVSGDAQLIGGSYDSGKNNSASGLCVTRKSDENPTVRLSGGTYTGGKGITCYNTNIGTLLEENCRYMLSGSAVTETNVDTLDSGVTVAPDPNAPVAYIDADGNPATQSGCTEITAATTELTAGGWYVVKENVTISGNLSVNADNSVSLILCDGATLTVPGSVRLENGWALNIYGQTEHTGTLKVGSGTLENSAVKAFGQHGGTIYFYGGTVTMQAKAGVQTVAGKVYDNRSAGMKTVWTDSPNEWCTISNREGRSVTVTRCKDHVWVYDDRGELGHTSRCDLCMMMDYFITPHSYTDWTDNGDGTHTGTCACKAESTENHTLTCTPNEDGLTHSGKCSECGYEAETEHDFNQTDEFGKKCECGAYLAATCNNQNYATLASAVEAAKNGGTVKLENDVAENIIITDGMNVTIDLNNKIWTTDGAYAHPTLTVTGGSVTVQNGNLTSGASSNAYTTVEVEGGKLTVGENMTIQGGNFSADRQFPAIEVKGGELTLSIGTKLGFGMKVSAEDKTLADYLPAGTAFHQVLSDNTESVAKGYVQNYVGKFTLTVVEHKTHSYTDGVCDCGFVCKHTGGNSWEASYFQKAVCRVCGSKYGELTTDTTAPTGSITIKERTPFQTFINTITFGLFFKEDVTATITAEDDSRDQRGYDAAKHAVKIEYLVSDQAFTEEDLEAQTFTDYKKAIDLTDEKKYVVYARLTDHAGNVTYISTDGFVIDKTAPSINDFADGQEVHICNSSYTVSVQDKNLKEVTVDGVKQTGDSITFYMAESGNTHTVVAEDWAGNTSAVKFTLHGGHNYNIETGVCENNCGAVAEVRVTDDTGTHVWENFGEALRILYKSTTPVTVTLLKDCRYADYTQIIKNELTVDLNGHSFGNASDRFCVAQQDAESKCKLTITGEGRFEPSILLASGSTLTVDENVTYVGGIKSYFHTYFGDTVTDLSVTLKGGTYGTIDLTYQDNDGNARTAGTLGDLLAPGYVFTDSTAADSSSAANVEVVLCTNHTWNNGVCGNCNLPCTHNWNGSECTVCGYVCPHSSVEERDGNTYCTTCKQQMAVKVESDSATAFFTEVSKAIQNAPNGSTVTIISEERQQSLALNTSVPANATVTLDLNGHTLGGYALKIDQETSKLTVIDSSGGNGRIGLSIWRGTLEFKPGNNKTTLSQLAVYGGDVKLYGGRIQGGDKSDLVLGDSVKLTDLLPKGYAFGLYVSDSRHTSLSYSDASSNKMDAWLSGLDLVPEVCDHEMTELPKGSQYYNHLYCPNCDEALEAVLTTADGKINGYKDLTDGFGRTGALSVAETTPGCTVTMYLEADWLSIRSTAEGFTLDANGCKIAQLELHEGTLTVKNATITGSERDGSFTVKTYSDFFDTFRTTLTLEDCVIQELEGADPTTLSANGPLTLKNTLVNGKTSVLSDQEQGLTVEESELNGDVTVRGSLTFKSGNASTSKITVYGAAEISGGTINELDCSGAGSLTVSGGQFGKITAPDGEHLIDCLKDGYAFYYNSVKLADGRSSTLEGVYVAEHTHGDYKWDTATHEKVCACGDVKETDTAAPTFGGITDGETYYQNTLTFTAEDAVSGIKEVKDGDTVLIADENGNYTVTADNKVHTITATDNAGKITVVTVTVYKVYNVTVSTDVSYKISGNSTANHEQNYTFTVKISNGYTATDDFTVKVNGETVTGTKTDGVYSYSVNGDKVTGELEITVDGVRDVTAPEAVVAFGRNFFRKFLNFITFGLFFKDTKEVTVTASDDGSGIADVRYVISKTPLTEESVKTSDGLKTLTANKDGEYTFNITPKSKGFVYVIVRDNAGNEKVIDSNGVVIYTDSAADTKSVSFRRLADNDVQFKVNLNGNTVRSLICGDTEIDSNLYTVDADGTVTLKNEFLRTLAADKYELTVTYNPMGVEYTPAEGSGSETPTTTEVKLTVVKAERTLKFSAPDATYDGEAYDDLRITDKPGRTTVHYKEQDAEDSTYDTTAPKNAGNYTVKITVDADDDYNAKTFTKDFTISPRKVTIEGVVVKAVKEYDGSAAAEDMSIDAAYIDGKCMGDDLTIDITDAEANFSDKNVGTAKTVTFSGFKLGGSAKDNYKLTDQPISVRADITAKNLTVENLKVKDKVYDGTNAAEIDGKPTLKGVVDGDTLTLVNGTPVFDSTAVGEDIAIIFTAPFTLAGDEVTVKNYTLTQPTGITGNIVAWEADGSEYSVNSNNWINTDFTVTAKTGYQLSLTDAADGTWTDTLTASEETADGKLTFYVKNTATGVISSAVSESYKIDRTAPTGTIIFNERTSFQKFISKITFGLFFKDDVTVKLTASDDASGVKSVEYYRSNKALTLEEVKALTDWTAGKSFGITAEDMTQFVIYARITDNVGNITYLSSDGIEFDTTVPELIGVENGKTYYVTKRVAAYDENLESVTVNGKPVTDNPFDLDGDKDAEYTIVITDKAGNVAEYKVIMKPISDITGSIKDITEKNVKSDDAEKIEKVTERILNIASESDEEVIGEEQWEKLLEAAEKCKKLEKRIAEVSAEIDRLTEAVNGYDIDKVTSADKADIEQLITDIDAMLAADNLTVAERAALEALKATAQTLLDRIAAAKVAAEADEITAVKDITKDNVTLDDKEALKKAEKALEKALDDFDGNYTEEEKKDLNDKLDTVKKSIDAIDNAEKAADEIKKLPDTDDVKLSDKDEIERVSGIVDALSENEKAMLGEEAIGKVEKLVEKINELAAESDKPSPATGENGKLTLWFVLFALSGAVICTVIAGKKKKQADR